MIASSPLAAVYVRVSTSAQEDGSSLQTQEAACRRFAAEKGFRVSEGQVYREVFSGVELWDRPQLDAMRQAVRAKVVAAVVVYAIDRLARDPVHLGVILSEAEHAGVPVLFVTEVLDDSPEGQLIRFVRGYAAKVEHTKIRERAMRGKRARVEAGKLLNAGAPLYGYRKDKAAGTRVLCEPEAAVVRQVYEWVEGGASIRSVVERLNRQGVPSPGVARKYEDGRIPKWGKGVIRRILVDPAYKGVTYAWRFQRDGKQAASMLRPESEWLRLPDGTTPAVVSADTWETVRERLAANKGDNTRNEARPYLLRGLVYCARCGRKLRGTPEHDRRVYRCASRETPGGPCGIGRVPADALEAWTWEHVSAVLADPSLIAKEVQRAQEAGPDEGLTSGLEAARRGLAKLARDEERLIRAFRTAEDDSFPPDLLKRELAAIKQERQQLEATVTDLERRLSQQQHAREQMQALAAYVEQVAKRLGSFDFANRRLALEALGISVHAEGSDPEKWEIRGNVPIGGEPYTSSSWWGCLERARRCWRARCPRSCPV